MSHPPESRPIWPRLAASAAIFQGNAVLVGERGKGAMAGFWSLPGGHVEPGEIARDAARREVLEETGVVARILGLVDLHEVIHREGGADAETTTATVSWHYVIAVHYGVWVEGEPVAASDCRTARFVPLDEIDALPLTEGAASLIRRAARLVETHGV
ncbi:MAG: NUDIX hydrolase [Hyphomicrobiaceae bacterium]|nr:NUDIX hydrolase [Hyphomicrobiaceae bacterium]